MSFCICVCAFWEGTHSCTHNCKGTCYHGSVKVEVSTTFAFTLLYVNSRPSVAHYILVILSWVYVIYIMFYLCILSEGGLSVFSGVLFTHVLKRVEQHYTSALGSMHSMFCSLLWMSLSVQCSLILFFCTCLPQDQYARSWGLVCALRGQWWPDWNGAYCSQTSP